MKKVLLAITACFICFNATAATLTPQKGVSILYINGEQAEDKIGENLINNGFNQVIVRMDKNLSRGSSPDVFTSAPYVLSFEVSGDEIVIGHPQARSTMEATKAFEGEQPQWTVRQDDKTLAYEQVKLQGKSGLFPYAGMGALVKQHNNERGIFFNDGELIDKPVKTQAIVESSSGAASAIEVHNSKEKVSSTNIDQLKAWYLKSSKEERKAFRRWMIDQE